VIRVVRSGSDEPAHVPDEIINAIRKRERNGAIEPAVVDETRAERTQNR
jgi:hypothetical protein